MKDITLGARVSYQGRMYVIRGFSPMGAGNRRILLERPPGKEWLEIDAKEFDALLSDDIRAEEEDTNRA